MADDKLRQELLYMVKLTSKYDFTKMEVVEGILRLESERQILGSVFGKRFKTRIFDIAAEQHFEDTCVICGQRASNHVICDHCMETIGGSEYAKSRAPKVEAKPETEAKPKKLNFSLKLKPIKLNIKPRKLDSESKPKEIRFNIKSKLQVLLAVLLSIIFVLQLGFLILFITTPEANPRVPERVSDYQLVAVSSEEEGLKEIKKDFPEAEGYTVSFGRLDEDYVGRFLLDKGDCCEDVEEALGEDELYDYFFEEDVYVYYISYYDAKLRTCKIGMAEINEAGAILVKGSFNDGRKTDCFYKFR